jgi:hypothetical protein
MYSLKNPSTAAVPMPTQPSPVRSVVQLRAFDDYLLAQQVSTDMGRISRFIREFVFFGVKEARACLFAGLFFTAIFVVPRNGLLGMPRYDVLLLIALAVQAWMVLAKLETIDELKAITLFHVVGFALEVFKTSSGIKSWAYPEFGYTKLFGVPLFSGDRQLHHPGMEAVKAARRAPSALLDGARARVAHLRKFLHPPLHWRLPLVYGSFCARAVRPFDGGFSSARP